MGNSLQKPIQNSVELQVQEVEDEEQHDSTFTCEICIEPMLSSKKFKNKNKCTHPFCLDCIIKFIDVKISENVAKIKCPALNCEQFLDPISCRPIISRQLFDKWCDVLCEDTLLGLDRCYCPDRNCSALVVNECGGIVKRSKCPNCKRLFCFQCKLSWHAGFGCQESGDLRDRDDTAFGVLVERKHWKRCPQCHHFVELIEGCRIVKCRFTLSLCIGQ
ncbi:unnamed protein product [Ilex paraguariensis]|uniref:RBR-type E3 ubiquitin transferase n=1 Tax=Ilex paraguariensis TaxID=185542 RepID=A0ABC8RGA3_9AQUA